MLRRRLRLGKEASRPPNHVGMIVGNSMIDLILQASMDLLFTPVKQVFQMYEAQGGAKVDIQVLS